MNRISLKTFIALLIAFMALQACKRNPADHPNSSVRETGEEVYVEALTMAVDTSLAAFTVIPIADATYQKGIVSETQSYYKENGQKTRWLYEDMPSRLFSEYMAVLDSVANDGLNPETYRRGALKKAVDSAYAHQLPTEQKVQIDREITASFLLLAKHLTNGRFSKRAYGNHSWIKPKYTYKNTELLLQLTDDKPLASVVAALLPQSKQYQRMKKMYVQLKKQVPDTVMKIEFANAKEFVFGYSAPVIEQLRKGLQAKGFEAVAEGNAATVDSTLIKTLQRFQQSNGLTPDGVLGKQTLYYLNMDGGRERDLLQLNMERMRVFNNQLGDNYAVVNVPEYKLSLFEKDSLLFETRVVVGKETTSTPIFTDTIRYVEFRPTWSVPQSIIRKEMIPQIIAQADPEKYQKRGYTMYENGKKVDPTTVDWTDPAVRKRGFRFVEAPSTRNSLGLVKFILTNDMSIYLHDTPSKYYFDREERALSHGCVRVQNPNIFAYYLLKNEEDTKPWTQERVDEAMHSGRHQNRITLKTKYKINIIYCTAWVDEEEKIIIKSDIYKLDDEQIKEIKGFES